MKKIIYKIFAVSGVAFLVFLVNACLKDDRYVNFGAVGNTIEFLDEVPGHATAHSFADPTSALGDTVVIRIHQAGPNATSVDLVCNLGFSQAGIDLYNLDKSHVAGTAVPSDSYTFPPSVTIKAGKDGLNNDNRTAEFLLIIYPNKILPTPGVNYVLSLGVTSVSPETLVSANNGVVLFNFYHNPYDGDYHSTGTRWNFTVAADYTGWNAGTKSPNGTIASTAPWDFPSTAVATVNATVSSLHAGNSNGGFGTINVEVDPATNIVTVISTADTGLNALVALPNLTSTWDPASKTFDLYYQYTNTSGTFRVLHDKLVHN